MIRLKPAWDRLVLPDFNRCIAMVAARSATTITAMKNYR